MNTAVRAAVAAGVLVLGKVVWSSEIPSGRLALSLQVSQTNITCCLPVEVIVSLENRLATEESVSPLIFPSMDDRASAIASLRLFATLPDGKEKEVIYPVVYRGPIKEIEGIPAMPSPIVIQPGQRIQTVAYVAGSWGWTDKDTWVVFDEPGSYSLRVEYTPFIVRDQNNKWEYDRERTLKSNSVRIEVKPGSQEDAKCWEEIKKLKYWWILYDPEMRNAEYLLDAARQELANELQRIALKYPDSSYSRYLDYTWIGLQIVSGRLQKSSCLEAVRKLEVLAADQAFTYRHMASVFRERIRD